MSFTYQGLKAQTTKYTVTDEEVDRQLQRLLQQNPRIASVNNRPTELGDEIVLDYAGFCGGVQFPGGTAEKQTLVLGSGMFIPGFEEQLVDKVPGQEVTVTVTFPREYHAEELAGKEAQFHCKIHEIRVKTAYELDDVFAREVGNCENLGQLRLRLKESIQAYSDEQGEIELQDTLLRQAAGTLELEISQEQIDQAVEEQIQALQAQLNQQGLNLEMYCNFLNTTEAILRQDNRATAIQNIRNRAAIEKIVELEHLEATQEEIGQALAIIAQQNKMTIEQLKPYYDAEFEQAVIRSVLTTKAMRLIRDAADVVVVDK